MGRHAKQPTDDELGDSQQHDVGSLFKKMSFFPLNYKTIYRFNRVRM